MLMHKLMAVALCTLLLLNQAAHALTFNVIYPEGEGDTAAAQPYVDAFTAYLKSKTGLDVAGQYFNDADEAELELQDGKIDVAIVSPDFFTSQKDAFKLTPLLRTIPIYSDGPYETYYILAGENMLASAYAGQRTPVALYASRSYGSDFVDNIVKDSAEIRYVPLRLQQTDQILTAIKNIAERKDTGFLLLTGYEYSVISALKDKNPTFATLKLVAKSAEQPSSPVVTIGDRVKSADLQKLKSALLLMHQDAEGKKILADLRLKGFSQ